jgi:predicted RND superfamily exporter protein
VIWLIWIALAACCAIGLRNYRVSNSMDAWMPDLAAPAAYQSYLVIGFPLDRVDPGAVAAKLRQLDVTSFCIDPAMVSLTQRVTGTTAEDFVVGRDGRYAGVFCFAREGVSDDEFIAKVNTALSTTAAPENFQIGGPTAFRLAMDQWSQRRLPLIMGAILLVGGAMLWLVTGNVRIAAISMIAISLSQIVFLGAISWLHIPIDMAVALVPPMMMGMGFSYAAHRALRRRSLWILAICGLAAAAGIASFATADLLPVRHFALTGVPGLLVVWLAAVTLVQPNRVARRRRNRWMRRLRRSSVRLARRHPRINLLAATVITALGILLAPKIQVQSNPLRFFPADSRIAHDFDILNQRLTGMLPSQIIVRGAADPRPLLRATPGMRQVIDVSLWIGGKDHTYLCLADNDAVERLAAQVPSWQSWARARGATLEWHGVAAQIHRSQTSMRRIALESIPSMMILIALAVLLIHRKISLATSAAWICLIPVCTMIFICVATSWQLGPVSLVIGSITTGVTVDDTLHLMNASRRRGSVRKGIIECFKPCVGSSLAGIVCFSLFMLSDFEPTRQFGLLMALATCCAMIANQLVLPVCLMCMLTQSDRLSKGAR